MSDTRSRAINYRDCPRRLLLVGLPLLLGLSIAPVAAAQGSSDTSSAEHPGHHRHMARFGAVEGPPAPSFMRDSVHLNGKALQQYTQRYDSHMATTKATRDSVRSSMQAARAAYEKGDRSQARTDRDSMKRQWKQLADQDKKFEDGLKDVLTKDEQTRYQQWKDLQQHEARGHWRHRGDREGGPSGSR